MATHIATIGEFQEGREDWKQYAERLQHFMDANGITNKDSHYRAEGVQATC